MAIWRFVLASLLLLGVVAKADAQIYKWVDEQGNVQFGDRPPAGSGAEVISTQGGDAGPTGTQRRESMPPDRMNAATGDTARTELQAPKHSQTSPDESPGCFTPITEAWGGRIADTREPISRRGLTADELGHLQALLGTFGQRWRGEVTEITCIRPEAAEPTKTDRYTTDLSGNWESGGVLKVEATLVGDGNRRVLREFFWFLPGEEGLRFRDAKTDNTTDLDRPRYDVETFVVAGDLLRYFRRVGGKQRRTDVFELRRTGRELDFREYYYVQGVLSGMREWELGG